MNGVEKNEFDYIEHKKINVNKQLFSLMRTDYFEIDTVLKILNLKTLPVEISVNNNQVFIRDLTNYIVSTDFKLKPNINKK
jgi:hypothetical protein